MGVKSPVPGLYKGKEEDSGGREGIDRIALMPFYICEHCAFETQDPAKKICDYCKSELLLKCPYCGKALEKEKTIYCGRCGEKLRISIVPIQ